jgi:hypothetical protein
MKQMQFCLTVAGILLGVVVTQGTVSTPSNVASVTTPSTGGGSGAAAVAEWYGPFSSWDNVKAKYGAKGDGVSDDTTAINNALANVGLNGNSPVLYFPNGTYRVTAKLLLKNRHYVEIHGQDRDQTVLKYDGATDTSYSGSSTLFHSDGISECAFARITFDGNGKSKTVVSESQSSGAQYFDAGNSWEDCVFKNSAVNGHLFDAGYFGAGFAGIDFVRCVFTNAAVGLYTGNWNAKDGWLTDCLVVNCGKGIDVWQGTAHAYHTTFKNNQTDFLLEQAANFISLVSNVSYSAGTFCKVNDVGSHNTPLLLKGNTVIDPTGVPIVLGQPGPVLLLDNTITSGGTAVSCTHSMQVDLMAVGNTWTVGNWLSVASGSGLKTNLVDNSVVSRSSLALTVPAPPTPASNLNRTVVNMPSGFTTAGLQSAINIAADGSVIHIPWPNNADQKWYLTSTVNVPTGKDLRIVGDGPVTELYWTGSDGGTMFSCVHPSHVTFSHLRLFGDDGAAGTGILVSNVGSSPARVYLRDVTMKQGIKADVRLGDCPNTVIDYCSRGASNTGVAPANGSAVILDGRGKVKLMNVEGGMDTTSYICTNGGQLYVENSYREAEETFGQTILLVSGASTVSFVSGKYIANLDTGGAVNFNRATGNGFAVANFSGKLFFGLCSGIIDWFKVTGPAAGDVWIYGNTSILSPSLPNWPVSNSSPKMPIQTMNWDRSATLTRCTDAGAATAFYTRQMLAQARAEYTDLAPMTRRDGQTDVLIEHVFFDLAQQNLWVKP